MSTDLAIRDEPHYLATVGEVRALAEQIATVDGAKDLAARARAAEVWARRAKLGEQKVELAIAARRWAERRAGELLIAEPDFGRGKKSVTVTDLGITHNESKRWQKLAEIPTDEFEQLYRQNRKTAAEDLKSSGRSKRDKAKKKQREAAERAARETIDRLGPDACRVEVADIRTWRPLGISCVITDPPYITGDALELHSLLADFALATLPVHGALAVMTWQPLLPSVFEAMSRDRLVYRWTAAWTFTTMERTPERQSRVFDGWKPVLVYHKDGWNDEATYLYDVIKSPDADKESHEWGQNIAGFRHLVRAFSQAGETVCDPFVGGGTTAIAALAESRLFVGGDKNREAVSVVEERLAA